MSELVRVQILLEKHQQEELAEIARQEGKAFSELVREYLATQLRQRRYQAMHRAAEQLRADYEVGGDLTDMTGLDSEDFLNE